MENEVEVQSDSGNEPEPEQRPSRRLNISDESEMSEPESDKDSDKDGQYADEEEPEDRPTKRKKQKKQQQPREDPELEVRQEDQSLKDDIEFVKSQWTRSSKYEESDVKWEDRARDFLNQMGKAIDDDLEAFSQKRPPLEKLKFIRVMKSELVKQGLQEALMGGPIFLNTCARFLEPYDGDLFPTPGLVNDVMDVLGKLTVNTDSLEDGEAIIQALDNIPMKRGSELYHKRQRLLNKWKSTVYRYNDDDEDDELMPRSSRAHYQPEELDELQRDAETPVTQMEGWDEVERYSRQIRRERGVAAPQEYREKTRFVVKPQSKRKLRGSGPHRLH